MHCLQTTDTNGSDFLKEFRNSTIVSIMAKQHAPMEVDRYHPDIMLTVLKTNEQRMAEYTSPKRWAIICLPRWGLQHLGVVGRPMIVQQVAHSGPQRARNSLPYLPFSIPSTVQVSGTWIFPDEEKYATSTR
jgi:hypothetical protein